MFGGCLFKTGSTIMCEPRLKVRLSPASLLLLDKTNGVPSLGAHLDFLILQSSFSSD